jgi:tRNA pseudouridine32 synthase/23S rRNA pseudouridine746 synthase
MPAGCPAILLRDERLIVLDKPPGLASVPGVGPEKADCLAVRVAARFAGARIVHRLDRDTSGVIVMALDADAHRDLSVQFQERLVEKVYIAIVAGAVAEDEGTVDLPIRKDLDHPPHQIVDHDRGRPSVTRWRVLERGAGWTRVELRPHTGRSHQLRVHMREIGHPILGDDLYAPPDVRAGADRLMLHALSLRFAHPTTSAPVHVEAPCPF